MTLPYPKNKTDWWHNVDETWEQLKDILNRFLGDEDILQADKLKTDRDPQLAQTFSKAWFAAPDNGSIYSIPGWNELCDLCSESFVLDE